ncbi:hypothetical protein N9Z06_01625, partial [Akkermansiaceae bacterium]|nr:hypothetical protein [Akkermansiaceae bacterium]
VQRFGQCSVVIGILKNSCDKWRATLGKVVECGRPDLLPENKPSECEWEKAQRGQQPSKGSFAQLAKHKKKRKHDYGDDRGKKPQNEWQL